MYAKICGVKESITLNYIINHKNPPKFVGFITNYAKSKRYIEYENLKKLTDVEKKEINFVSVLVNPDEEILEKIKNLNFDYYQLYDVSAEKTKSIKEKYNIKIISALTIENKKDVERYKDYELISDIILFDSKGYEKSVGFDHELLRDLLHNHKGKFILSYNNCETIREYYKDFEFSYPKWHISYAYNTDKGGDSERKSKESHEIIIQSR